jgi:hypothetical protein
LCPGWFDIGQVGSFVPAYMITSLPHDPSYLLSFWHHIISLSGLIQHILHQKQSLDSFVSLLFLSVLPAYPPISPDPSILPIDETSSFNTFYNALKAITGVQDESERLEGSW